MGILLETDRYLKGPGPIRNRSVSGVYPALHLEYLGVDKRYEGSGLGTDMLTRALLVYVRAIIDMGIPVMTLVPLREKLIQFYSDRGFVSYATHLGERRMMLTAAAAIEAYEKAIQSE